MEDSVTPERSSARKAVYRIAVQLLSSVDCAFNTLPDPGNHANSFGMR